MAISLIIYLEVDITQFGFMTNFKKIQELGSDLGFAVLDLLQCGNQ